MNNRRVFLGLSDHGCRLFALSLGLREKGWKALYYSFYPEPNGADVYRSSSELPWLLRWNHRMGSVRSDRKKSVLMRRAAAAANELSRVILLFWVLAKFDVIIFGAWNSFFLYAFGNRFRIPLWVFRAECALFRVFGKKVIYTFWGGDSRPTYLDGMYVHGESWTIERIRKEVAWQRGRIDLINDYAHEIVDIPPQGQYFHRRPFVVHSQVGLTCLPAFQPAGGDVETVSPATVQVLHTPSDPLRKGTALVESMVRQLQSEGYPIEYKSATGISRKEVLAMMRSAQIFFDEAHSDFPASCTTVEAGCNGAAPVSCGFSADFWAEQEPEMTRKLGHMNQGDVLSYVRSLLADRGMLEEARRQARAFVEDNWNLGQITDRYIRLIDGGAPKSWYFDPAKAGQVLGGFFMPIEKARGFLREYLRRYGTQALHVDDKPALRAALEEFARGPDPV